MREWIVACPLLGILTLLIGSSFGQDAARPPPWRLISSLAGSEIVIEGEHRFAGAISRLQFRGQEFVDDKDHGRELQSAVAFDSWGECLNPAEAGSARDAAGPTTSSKLLSIDISNDAWSSKTQMAYWMEPKAAHHVNPFTHQFSKEPQPCTTHAERANVKTARNDMVLSNVVLDKRVEVGTPFSNSIAINVDFVFPSRHTVADFEIATIYMPSTFNHLMWFDPQERDLVDGGMAENLKPGRSVKPGRVPIWSTADGRHAAAIAADSVPWPLFNAYRWPDTAKLNCIYRQFRPEPGSHKFRCLLVLGTSAEVGDTLAKLEVVRRKALEPTPGADMERSETIEWHQWRDPESNARRYSLTGKQAPYPGWVPEGKPLVLRAKPADGYHPLYACHVTINDDTFISTKANCEDAPIQDPPQTLGWAASVGRADIARCLVGGRHAVVVGETSCQSIGGTNDGVIARSSGGSK